MMGTISLIKSITLVFNGYNHLGIFPIAGEYCHFQVALLGAGGQSGNRTRPHYNDSDCRYFHHAGTCHGFDHQLIAAA